MTTHTFAAELMRRLQELQIQTQWVTATDIQGSSNAFSDLCIMFLEWRYQCVMHPGSVYNQMIITGNTLYWNSTEHNLSVLSHHFLCWQEEETDASSSCHSLKRHQHTWHEEHRDESSQCSPADQSLSNGCTAVNGCRQYESWLKLCR